MDRTLVPPRLDLNAPGVRLPPPTLGVAPGGSIPPTYRAPIDFGSLP